MVAEAKEKVVAAEAEEAEEAREDQDNSVPLQLGAREDQDNSVPLQLGEGCSMPIHNSGAAAAADEGPPLSYPSGEGMARRDQDNSVPLQLGEGYSVDEGPFEYLYMGKSGGAGK